MSNTKLLSTDTSVLTQRLQNAEKSIIFLQREHASTLASLHEEITKLQQEYSDLTFQLTIGGTVINSVDDSKIRKTVEQLENELYQYKDKIKDLNENLEEKEKLLKDYENRLIVNDRKHALELHKQYDKQRELKIELEHRSILIAELTNQLHREKQHQQNVRNRIQLGQILLPNKPTKLKYNDEQQQRQLLPSNRHISKRSSSPSNQSSTDQELTKVLFIGRRPTPPQQLQLISSKNIESHNEQLYTKRQRQLLNSHTENMDLNKITSSRPTNKLSTVLPPIVSKKMPLKAFATITLQREGDA
ncbi:unnamed protein product [Rotaria sordida]|uniref:CCDC92/74 N-terminal domain-containing protein n=1 Tax=Rotaria sordida TaxID=392033 RepID=A0A818QP92_9BILA|nr:unnamed protein product [Rotaria sordida]CAF0833970.1 unnamed protein product [Rotaria sordida]CAF0879017.1 unnamed protein product [Rotaria sordida]CAF3643700.1 unnamed protein product [Rotaria sordida]